MARHIGVFAAIALCLVGAWLVQRSNRRVAAAIHATESGTPSFDKKEFRESFQKLGRDYDAALQALAQQNLPGISRAYADVCYGFGGYLKHFPEHEAEPGVTVKAWHERKEQAFRTAVLERWPALLDGMSSGEVPTPLLRDLINNLSYFGFKEPEQRFKEAEPRIHAARAKAAPDWLVVSLEFSAVGYDNFFINGLQSRWNSRAGRKLVFGYALSDLESRATWKKLVVRLEQDTAHYQPSNPKLFRHDESPSIPRALKATFELTGAPDVPTSWDKLPPLDLRVELPETILVKIRDGRSDTQAERLRRDKTKELHTALEVALAKLPPFELFPGLDPTTLNVRVGERLDARAVQALSYLDKPRLVAQLDELSRDARLQNNLAPLVVSLNLDSLATWLTQTLPQLDRKAQAAVADELAKRPSFGDYEPLLAMLKRPELGQEVFNALRGQLHVPKVRQTLLAESTRPANRWNFTSLYISEAPLDEVRQQVRIWLADKETDFIRMTLNGLGNRDRKAILQLALDEFPRVPDPVKALFLHQLGSDRHAQFDPLLPIVQEAVRSSNQAVRDACRDLLMDRAGVPAAWDLVRDLAKSESDPRRREQMTLKLIYTARQAHPETGPQWLIEQLRHPVATVRHQAVGILVFQDKLANDDFKPFVSYTSDNPDDRAFMTTVIKAIHQHHRLRSGWDFSETNSSLTALLVSGTRQPDKAVQRQSVEVMQFAVKKGGAHYKEFFRETAAGEQSESAVRVNARQPSNATR